MLWFRLLYLGCGQPIYVAAIKCASIMQKVCRKKLPWISDTAFLFPNQALRQDWRHRKEQFAKTLPFHLQFTTPGCENWVLIMLRGRRHFNKPKSQKFQSLGSTASYFFPSLNLFELRL